MQLRLWTLLLRFPLGCAFLLLVDHVGIKKGREIQRNHSPRRIHIDAKPNNNNNEKNNDYVMTQCLLAKRNIVADSSNEWPTNVPAWALQGWEIQPTSSDDKDDASNPCPNGNDDCKKMFSVTNDSPTWELVLAKALPEDGRSSVSPASAILAPRGGCDNLCDDNERYSDTCEFTVSGDAKWVLMIRTEDQRWIFPNHACSGSYGS